MLEYDNTAFYFFLLAVIILYLVPSYYCILTAVYGAVFPPSSKELGTEVRTSAEKAKAKKVAQKKTGMHTIMTRNFKVNLGFTVFLTLLFIWICVTVAQNAEIASFDPYAILDLDHNAEKSAIKKAYRAKSLKFHPDKNPDNPSAEAMFMMIAKAYEALTDEVSKANWEKYGNPDGKQSLEVSIGLPTFLLNNDNRQWILSLYLLIMVVVIPFTVYRYYSESSKYGEMHVLYKSWSWLYSAMDSTINLKVLPEILAGCAEFHKIMPDSPGEKEWINSLLKILKPKMQKPKYMHLMVLKGNLLMHAHLTRSELPSTKFQTDLDFILSSSGRLIDAMIDVNQNKQNLANIIAIIEFNQFLTQGLWVNSSTLLQLPHFTEAETKHATSGKTGAGDTSSLAKYLSTPDHEKKGMKDFTEAQKKDVLTCCKIIPQIDVSVSCYVEDDEDSKIYESDLITIKVKIDRKNLDEGESAGAVHAPLFPVSKKESWWVILSTNQNKLVNCTKVTGLDKITEHEIKLGAPPPGKYNMNIILKSNDYVECDKKVAFTFETLSASLLPETKHHQDDLDLDDETTLFEELMNSKNIDDDSSDDEDEVAGAGGAIKTIANVKGVEKKKVLRAGDGSDSDSDSSDSDDELPKLENESKKTK